MTEERKGQLYKAWDELSRRQLSNSENLGRAILSLSIAGLAFSLAFIKDVVSPDVVTNLYLLHGSWWAFALAIVTTLVSYHTSQAGLEKQFAQIRNDFAGKKNPKLEHKERRLFMITKWLGYFSHGFYLTAIGLTIIFIQTNGGLIMSTKKTHGESLQEQTTKAKEVPQKRVIEQGAPRVEILPDTNADPIRQGAPRVEILPELPPNVGPGSDASTLNTDPDADVSQPEPSSASSEQGSSESSDK